MDWVKNLIAWFLMAGIFLTLYLTLSKLSVLFAGVFILGYTVLAMLVPFHEPTQDALNEVAKAPLRLSLHQRWTYS